MNGRRDSEIPTERDNGAPPEPPSDAEAFAILVKNMLEPLEKKIDVVIAAYQEERELRLKTEELLERVSGELTDLRGRVEDLEEKAAAE